MEFRPGPGYNTPHLIEKFVFNLKSPKLRRKLILVKEEVETRHHIVLKILAYLLYYDPRLKIESAVRMHYQPDLVIEGDHGIPELWIDCGQIAIRKVESLAQKLRTTRIVLVKQTKRELEVFQKVVSKKVDHSERIQYLAFEPGFVDGIAEALDRQNDLTLYEVMENVIGLALNGEIFESTLYH